MNCCFIQGIVCPVLQGNNETKVTEYKKNILYAVSCKRQDRVLFGHDLGGSYAKCGEGDYHIGGARIGLSPPDCVGKLVLFLQV